MASAVVVGLGIAGAAVAGRAGMRAFLRWQARPAMPRALRYGVKGFEPDMTRREAMQILGIRDATDKAAVKTKHRKLMVINHPDRGGSPYLATKINEAKEFLLSGKTDPQSGRGPFG